MSAFKKVSRVSQGSQGRVVVWGVLGWLCLLNVSAWGQFSGGTGTKVDPYLISEPNDMQAIGLDSVHWDKHFILTTDLDLTGMAMTPIGNASPSSTTFSGTFNGNGYTIANLSINLPATDYVGLFGVVANAVDPNAIFNLGLFNSNITGKSTVGALVGILLNSALSGCYTDTHTTGPRNTTTRSWSNRQRKLTQSPQSIYRRSAVAIRMPAPSNSHPSA